MLDLYYGWSSHEINRDKLCIHFSKKTTKAARTTMNEVFGFQEMNNELVYLGNSLVLSRNISKDFKLLKDRVNLRLNGWTRLILSKARKATLIKSVF